MEKESHHIAYHDQPTGLPNRILLLDHLSMAMSQANRNRMKVALLMLDLDKFKEVNDSLGHHTGDMLLQAVANKFTGILPKADTVAPIGGDEFVLVLPEQKDEKAALRVAENIVEVFRNPFDFDGHSLVITCSIGIALYQDHGADMDSILKNANSAMYRAKQTRGSQYQLYMEEQALLGREISSLVLAG